MGCCPGEDCGAEGLPLAPRSRGTSAHLTPPGPGPQEEGQQWRPRGTRELWPEALRSLPRPQALAPPFGPRLIPLPLPRPRPLRDPRVLALPLTLVRGSKLLPRPLSRPMPLSRLWPLPLALALSPPPSSCPVPRSSFRPQGAGAGRTKAGLPLRRAGYLLVPGSSD